MNTYHDENMVKAKHIIEINKQLKKFGSKVKENLLDGKDHSLAHILYLACGDGIYGISIDKINSICGNDFEIQATCKGALEL